MKFFFLQHLAVLSILVASTLQPAFASELRVHDCEGNLRASTEIQEGGTKNILLTLPSEEANVSAKLSKIDSESAIELRAKDQSLNFISVQSGDWKVCRNDGAPLAFTTVEFADGESDSLKVASLVAGGAAVLSGIAIAAGGSNNNSDNTIGNISEPNQPDRAESAKPASALQPGSSSRPNGEVIVESRCDKRPATLAATNNGCREGEEAPVISPYD